MLQPKPQTKAAVPAKRQQFSIYSVVLIGAMILALALGGRSYFHHPAGDPTPTVVEQQARLAAYVQAGVLPLPEVPEVARQEALASMNLAQQPAEMRQAVEQSKSKLAWLTLWDDRDEDGDTVEIVSQGYSRVVKLTNSPQRIAVPMPAGGVVNVRGVYDGGGGITVAIQTEQGKVTVPLMAVGQVIGVPVSTR